MVLLKIFPLLIIWRSLLYNIKAVPTGSHKFYNKNIWPSGKTLTGKHFSINAEQVFPCFQLVWEMAMEIRLPHAGSIHVLKRMPTLSIIMMQCKGSLEE